MQYMMVLPPLKWFFKSFFDLFLSKSKYGKSLSILKSSNIEKS